MKLKEADELPPAKSYETNWKETRSEKKETGHPERQKQIPLLRTTGRQFFLNSEMFFFFSERHVGKVDHHFTNLEAHVGEKHTHTTLLSLRGIKATVL